jgi:hypothetical protein
MRALKWPLEIDDPGALQHQDHIRQHLLEFLLVHSPLLAG